MENVKTGTIVDVSGSWGSGVATLTLKDSRGKTRTLHADNGPFFRALDAVFGGISSGHSFDVSAVRGKKIRYATVDWSDTFLTGFTPVEE